VHDPASLLRVTELERCLASGLDRLGLSTGDDLAADLLRFVGLLEGWNRAFSLTAVRRPEDMVVRHILDSLSIAGFLHGESVLDAGTGAGLPGIPLALAEKQRRFTLLDSVGKKVRFVRHVVAELGIRNITVEQVRLESFRPAVAYDTVTCRAFGSLAGFVGACGGLVAAGGRLLAMKGGDCRQELAAVPAGWRSGVTAVRVPFLDASRHVVVMERC